MSQYMFPEKQGGPQQAFPPNRSSPPTVSQPGQNFQNVPLGSSNPGQNKPSMQTNQLPPGAPGQFPPNLGYTQRPQIPPTQLPPPVGLTQPDPSTNPFNQPPTKQDMAAVRPQNEHQNFQNGPPQFPNGHSQFHNGPSVAEPPNNQQPHGGPPASSLPPISESPFNQSTLPGPPNQQTGPVRPPSNQPASFPSAPNQFGQSSQSGQLPPNQFGASGPQQIHQFGGSGGTTQSALSNLAGPPPNQLGQSSNQFNKPPNQFSQPPNQAGQPLNLISQPTSQPLGQLPTHGAPSNVQTGRTSQMGVSAGPMGLPQIGSSQGQMGPPQGQMGPPQSQMGPPPIQMGPPQGQTGPPHGQMGPPQSHIGPTQGLMGPPQGQMGPPQGQVGITHSHMGAPQGQMGPPQGHMGPPQGQMGTPQGQMGPPQGQMGPPQGQMGSLQGQMGPPQGQPGPPQSQIGSLQNQMGPPQGQMGLPPGQAGPPQMNQPPKGPPRVGQSLSSNQGRPGMPINQNSYQYGPGSGPNQPPLGQPGFPPNQLSNQMQNLNLNNQRQYPGVGQKNLMNGESAPHMPPPLNQNSYANGQQMRGPPGPGYPPMPGQTPMPGQASMPGQPPMPGQGMAPGGYPQQNYPQQQARRLDPDQMPSPVQVTQDDQQNRSGVFVTNQKGLVPPLVTTNFVVQDQGNASPRLIRSTMYNVPITQDLIKQTAVPFSLVISPMARHADQEYPPPIVNFGELGPVRCNRCKAYMCPFMQFIDSGRRFQCLFCKATTDVPTEYFQHLDHTGQRMDKYERPELVLGTYEFVATADYCRNNSLPKPPAVIFVIDVSYNNVKSGLVNLLCSQMKEIIQNLPVDQGQEKSNMRVGFITYNSSVHFYNIKGTLAAPQMLVVGDVHEMFMPLLDGFLCTPEESGPVIDALMQQIPAMFADTRETETILLPAIQAGMEALKASECTGKLLVFHSTLPSAEAPGKLKNRDDRKLLGTDKEKTVLSPQNQSYNQLGQDCAGVGCSVDLFIFNNAYIDLATIGQVSRLTGGEIYKYTYFQADLDGERVVNDVIINISRPIAFDAIMRVRTSTGVRPTDFYGHFFMSNTTDMELASIDSDKAVAVEIKHDDKLQEEEGVYIQVALLYTSCSGQRRLRIINLSLKSCSQMADLYRSCDLDTMINYFSKQAVYKLLDSNPKALKDSIVHRAAQTLTTYRKNCASPSSAGQLILPECMKLLPLYINCLLKSDAISGGSDMTIDDRSFAMQAVMTMDIVTSVNYFYPRLIPVHDLDTSTEPVVIPASIRTSIEKINEQGIYILENGIHMFLWFGLGVNPEIIQKLFGAPSAIQVDIERQILPELDNPYSLAVRSIIDEIRIQRHRCMRLTIVRQREKLEPVFKHFLVEDQGADASPSYVDFLCHLHKEIRTLLS